ncbi:hypothetical protein G7Y79_00003g009320 [Physcia stellaris]|nr:hypothetical protein G7Y79_00003g009320 [Physcia stellaris]
MAFVLYTCMMRAVFVASCLVISTHALVIGASEETSKLNFTDLTFSSNVHCTTEASWLVSPIEDLVVYDIACQGAMRIARQELQTFNPDTEFEFYDRASRPVTTKPKILLPRKYSVGKHPTPFTFGSSIGWERENRSRVCVAGSLGRPSCTLAIAMIDALGPGAALPGQPPGPFGSSDVLKMGDLTTHWNPQNLAAPFFECVRRSVAGRRSSALGWSRVGERDPFTWCF